MGPERAGRKVAILGDTCNNEKIATLCTNADCLVHEATLENEQEKRCKVKGHSTPGKSVQFFTFRFRLHVFKDFA